MSASLLREAAALMRERANATSTVEHGQPWRFLITDYNEGDFGGVVRGQSGKHAWTVAESDFANDAEHIASWHPAVALAVADWLDEVASMCEAFEIDESEDPSALAVARAYLGRDDA